MLFLVHGHFERSRWEDTRRTLPARTKKPEVKVVFELLVPGDFRFTGIYESRDATSLHKYLRRLSGLDVQAVMPALPLDNILIVDEMGAKKPD
jgi:hypothetical protein